MSLWVGRSVNRGEGDRTYVADAGMILLRIAHGFDDDCCSDKLNTGVSLYNTRIFYHTSQCIIDGNMAVRVMPMKWYPWRSEWAPAGRCH